MPPFRSFVSLMAVVAGLLLAAPAMAADPALAALAPFVGKTWRSVEGGAMPDGTAFNDVAKWEWQADGHVVLITHSLNNGVYGGVTLMHYDHKAGHIIFRYATTGGFYTEGSVIPKDGGFEISEAVKGTSGGPSDVQTFMKIEGDRYTVESRMMVNGSWSAPQSRTYIVDPDAHVTFGQ